MLYAQLLLLLPFLWWSPTQAAELFTLDEVKITYREFFPGGQDPLITQNALLPDRALGKELNLGINTSILKVFYWNNIIHSTTDEYALNGKNGQFRVIGLEFTLGVDFSKIISAIPITLGYYHYSQHILDSEHSLGHFPVRDGIELNLYIYRGKK